MKSFSAFNIQITQTTFTGDKIKIAKILNRPIIIHDFKLGPSKHFKNECLTLQIEYNGTKHICFSGSSKLIEQIKQVPPDGLPFQATIEKEDEMYLFT
ncbi:hypothetical protein GCM10017764_17870 [Sphingobacterium griseoflavum]|uniref:Uncharacterized protein n=1 Tax=Sphingobacterium griseoflavum TaxID=1474952 RepID=A0ABQ3HUJ3_9SPHI|nr:hypothetical protein GCM10017764_17870 [Sphingobacterium griseoflavum]